MLLMRKIVYSLLLLVLFLVAAAPQAVAQDRVVQNRPYTDLRPFHFGVVVGTHFQDMELVNAGPQIVTAEDGTTSEAIISVDQDRWDMGFNVGVLGELRLNTHLQLRVAPTMYFGTRHLTPTASRASSARSSSRHTSPRRATSSSPPRVSTTTALTSWRASPPCSTSAARAATS